MDTGTFYTSKNRSSLEMKPIMSLASCEISFRAVQNRRTIFVASKFKSWVFATNSAADIEWWFHNLRTVHDGLKSGKFLVIADGVVSWISQR